MDAESIRLVLWTDKELDFGAFSWACWLGLFPFWLCLPQWDQISHGECLALSWFESNFFNTGQIYYRGTTEKGETLGLLIQQSFCIFIRNWTWRPIPFPDFKVWDTNRIKAGLEKDASVPFSRSLRGQC